MNESEGASIQTGDQTPALDASIDTQIQLTEAEIVWATLAGEGVTDVLRLG